jgi:hypothetical protein
VNQRGEVLENGFWKKITKAIFFMLCIKLLKTSVFKRKKFIYGG